MDKTVPEKPASRDVLLPQFVAVESAVGLGALLTWGGSYVRWFVSEQVGINALALWSLSAGAFCLFISLLAAKHFEAMSMFNQKNDWFVLVVLCVASSTIATGSEYLPTAVIYPMTAIVSFGEMWIYLQWAAVLNRQRTQIVPLAFLLGYAIRFSLGLAIQYLPLIAASILQLLLLAASVLLLLHANSLLRQFPELFEEQTCENKPTSLDGKLMGLFVVLLILDGFFSGVFETLYSSLPTDFNTAVSVARLITTLVLLGAFFAFKGLMSNPLSLVTIVAVCICLPFAPLMFMAEAPAEVAHSLTMVMSYLLRCLVAIFLVTLAHETHRSVFQICALGWGCERLLLGIGTWFGATEFFRTSLSVLASLLTYSVLVICLIVVMALYTRNLHRAADAEQSSGKPDVKESMEELCQSFGNEHGLTAREIEIMTYICRGYSKPRIAELTYLSENTVREYSRRLYTKLDIHCKQELIDLIGV